MIAICSMRAATFGCGSTSAAMSVRKVARPVCLKIITANRPGILAEVGTTFSQSGVNIEEATCRAGDDRAVNLFSFTVTDLTGLKLVIRALQKVSGVLEVERV